MTIRPTIRAAACCRQGSARPRSAPFPARSLLNAQAQSSFDWKRFKGEKIEILLVKSPRGDLLTKYHKEFEDLTGIEVGSEMIPEQQQRQKAVIEFNSGNPSFDVIGLSYHVQKRQFAKNNWLTDRAPVHQRQDDGCAGSRLRRLREGRPLLCGRAGWPRVEPSVQPRPVGALLQQGIVRRQGHRVPEGFCRDARRRRKAQRSGQGRLRVRRPRLEECQRAGVEQLSARLRRRVHRQERQADHRHARGDRRREDVPDAAGEIWTAGRGGLQLERIAEPVPAGQGRDVARRHRLRAAARGSDQVHGSSAKSATA